MNINIELHSDYPITKPAPNEKIVFRDIPIGVRDDEILEFLNKQPGIVLKTDVINGRIRDNDRLTQFLSGEKFVYVKGKFPLLSTTSPRSMTLNSEYDTNPSRRPV